MKKNNVIPAIDNPSFTNKHILYIKSVFMFPSGDMKLMLTDRFQVSETFKSFTTDPLGNKVEMTTFVNVYTEGLSKPKYGVITLKAGSPSIESLTTLPVAYPIQGFSISEEKVIGKDNKPTNIYHARAVNKTAAMTKVFNTCIEDIKKNNKKFWAYIVKDYKANLKAKEEGSLELPQVFKTKEDSKSPSAGTYTKQTLSKYSNPQLKKLAKKHNINARASKSIIEALLNL